MKRIILGVFLFLIIVIAPLPIYAQGAGAPLAQAQTPTPLPPNAASISMRQIASSLRVGGLSILLAFLFFGLTLRLRRE